MSLVGPLAPLARRMQPPPIMYREEEVSHMKWALLSVWDKTGLAELAGALRVQGVEILASGGTGKTIGQGGIDFLEVCE